MCALREQYARLQDDYKGKLCETSRLRAELDGYKREARECNEERQRLEIRLVDAQERLKSVEEERDCLRGDMNFLLNIVYKFKLYFFVEGCKDQLTEQEQSLLVAKQRYRETVEELEDLRSMIREQAAQLDDYRNKFLAVRIKRINDYKLLKKKKKCFQAQQQVEEQRRQMDLMEMDNARMNENVNLEIGRVKVKYL